MHHVDRDGAGGTPATAPAVGLGLSRRLDHWVSGYPDVTPVRLLHGAPTVLWRLGLGKIVGRPWLLLTTMGRTSGLPRRTPLAAHRVRGRLYVWTPYGSRAQWYKNLMADPIVAVQSADGAWTARARRLDDRAEAAELYQRLKHFDARGLARYLADQGVVDSEEAFARDVRRLHVVRLQPVPQPGPPPLEADLLWVWLLAALLILVWWVLLHRKGA